jgi:hypothetical protein
VATSSVSLRTPPSVQQTPSTICSLPQCYGSSGSYRSPTHFAMGHTFTGPQPQLGRYGPHVHWSTISAKEVASIRPIHITSQSSTPKPFPIFQKKCTIFQDSYFDKGAHLWILCRRVFIFVCYIYKFRIQILIDNIYINHFVSMV